MGIISGSAEALAASENWPNEARSRGTPIGPKNRL